jgi:DNA-binding NtrC family response regulator
MVAGRSPGIRQVRARIEALAPLEVPVLIRGESGSGRDCVARALHAHDPRADTPLLSLRCGESGACWPTPAGTIYLDEIGRLSTPAQARWLESLRGGEGRGVRRILASTSEDLARCAREGRFLPDLWDRLARFAIFLPPLRERIDDISQLVPVLVAKIGRALGRQDCHVQSSVLTRLKARSWPGNVRDLEVAIERMVAFSPTGEITGACARAVLSEDCGELASLRAQKSAGQREELLRLLEECEGNLAAVARRLDLSRAGVSYRVRKYGLLGNS